MQDTQVYSYIQDILVNMPSDWTRLTTHRLDIYTEKLAKKEFLEEFENLFEANNSEASDLEKLPTAYDYIRLGHPLSCILEWTVAKLMRTNAENAISFSSNVTPILAILRKNLLEEKHTRIVYLDSLPENFDEATIRKVYGYEFETKKINNIAEIEAFNGSVVLFSPKEDIVNFERTLLADFVINAHPKFGSILLVNREENEDYVAEIQHVRRRETIAMTPANCVKVLKKLADDSYVDPTEHNTIEDKNNVIASIQKIAGVDTKALVGSSGLSIQYAIMMGLIDDALEKHPEKEIKFIVPPNCYGGTNDQARRVAACIDKVEIVDLPVDGDNDMVKSVNTVLDEVARQDAIPYIIAEIPTNPRVEVPDLDALKAALEKERTTANGNKAIAPVFILDQTFCPNVQFLGEGNTLSTVRAISYASGSKFPSGGLCTAGYCIANDKAAYLTDVMEKHLVMCDNEATDLQYEILANQLPTMNQRIADAYANTREFVDFIEEVLPDAKINFVSKELAAQGFTPSVFSLDLPTKGNTDEEREAYKRALNHKLINKMILEIPHESKYCVSYGQLKGCYWTIPATSTQGTTKEGDKDYIARVALSGNMDLERHKQVFADFVAAIKA